MSQIQKCTRTHTTVWEGFASSLLGHWGRRSRPSTSVLQGNSHVVFLLGTFRSSGLFAHHHHFRLHQFHFSGLLLSQLRNYLLSFLAGKILSCFLSQCKTPLCKDVFVETGRCICSVFILISVQIFVRLGPRVTVCSTRSRFHYQRCQMYLALLVLIYMWQREINQDSEGRSLSSGREGMEW